MFRFFLCLEEFPARGAPSVSPFMKRRPGFPRRSLMGYHKGQEFPQIPSYKGSEFGTPPLKKGGWGGFVWDLPLRKGDKDSGSSPKEVLRS